MSRMTVTLDDDLLREAQEALGTKTKRETIIVALQEARRRRLLARMLERRGTVELGFTFDEVHELREQG